MGLALPVLLASAGQGPDSPAGEGAAITYGPGKEIARLANPEITESRGLAASRLRMVRMPRRAQGESICYGLDGRTLYLTSEKKSPPLLVVAPVEPSGGGR